MINPAIVERMTARKIPCGVFEHQHYIQSGEGAPWLDTWGGAQYEAKENVYQLILERRSHWTRPKTLETTSTRDHILPCRAKSS